MIRPLYRCGYKADEADVCGVRIKSLGVRSEWEATGKGRVANSQCGGVSSMGGPFGLADLGELRRLAGTTSRS